MSDLQRYVLTLIMVALVTGSEPPALVRNLTVPSVPLVQTRQSGLDTSRVDGKIVTGHPQTLPIQMKKSEFASVVVGQRGVDLHVTVTDPTGQKVVEVVCPSLTQSRLPVVWSSKLPGKYLIEIQLADPKADSTPFTFQRVELRPTRPTDLALIQAQADFYEAVSHFKQSQFEEALLLVISALSTREKLSGPDTLDVADCFNLLGNVTYYQKKQDLAETWYARSLALREKQLPDDDPDLATVRYNLAWVWHQQKQLSKAEAMFRAAISTYEKGLGINQGEALKCYEKLGEIYFTQRDVTRLAAVEKELTDRIDQVAPTEASKLASSISTIGGLYLQGGNYPKSIQIQERARSLLENLPAPNKEIQADVYTELGKGYFFSNDLVKAETYLAKALAVREQYTATDEPNIAAALSNLALVYRARGDLNRAEPLLLRAVSINEKIYGTEHEYVGASLSTLGLLYISKENFRAAEPLFQRALAMFEKVLPPDHPNIPFVLNNLATIYQNLKEPEKALPLFERALTLNQKILGPDHPTVAALLNNLGLLQLTLDHNREAISLLEQSLTIYQKRLSNDHPSVAICLRNLARSYSGAGEIDKAVDNLSQSNEIIERDLNRNLIVGSERQKFLYLNKSSNNTNESLNLHLMLAPNNLKACKMAFTALLRRKGRALDAMTEGIEALRKRALPEDKVLFDDLLKKKSELATLILKGAGTEGLQKHQEAIKNRRETIDQLEAQISARSAEFRAQFQPITLEAIQKAIPPHSALVEFATYKIPDSPGHRFAAYVLQNEGEPKAVDLGDNKIINRVAAEFRKLIVLANSGRNLTKVNEVPATRREREKQLFQAAQKLDQLILKPVRALVGSASHLLISPDGDLNQVPFAALVDENGKYCIENYLLTYLTSGRDLLRLEVKIESAEPPLIMADPDYGTGSGPLLFGQTLGQLPRLEGTEQEGKMLKHLFPKATLLMKADATEETIKTVHRPEVLHIATHGYFYADPDQPGPDAPADTRSVTPRSDAEASEELRMQNPLTRSYLFFAGANRAGDTEKDGTLTALEAAGLDLWGTKLVVLSACDTGLGEIRFGEGIYGLRRALVLAGSETQMMSLWPVADVATSKLMVAYYQRLKKAEGRSQALRNVQLNFLKDPKYRHPYYWASFFTSGEWANLAGVR